MVDLYSTCIKDAAGDVTVESIVTLQVDRCVASHPCGVLAVAVNCKDTGRIIACSSSGIIVKNEISGQNSPPLQTDVSLHLVMPQLYDQQIWML